MSLTGIIGGSENLKKFNIFEASEQERINCEYEVVLYLYDELF